VKDVIKNEVKDNDYELIKKIISFIEFNFEEKIDLRNTSVHCLTRRIIDLGIESKNFMEGNIDSDFMMYDEWFKQIKNDKIDFDQENLDMEKILKISVISNFSSNQMTDHLVEKLKGDEIIKELCGKKFVYTTSLLSPIPIKLIAQMGIKARYRLLDQLVDIVKRISNNILPSPSLLETLVRTLYLTSDPKYNLLLFKCLVGDNNELKLNIYLELINYRLFRYIK
jgi:hypothetical protein